MKLFMPMSAALALALQAPFVVEAKPGTKAFSIVTPGQSPCHATPWVGSQSDPTAVFFSTIEPANTVYRINGTTGEVKWNVSMGTDRHGVRSSPIEADGLLHIGTDFGEFVALDTETGETVWSYHRPNITCFDVQFPPTHFRPCEVYSSALLTNGIRFQGSEDNHTRAFNASTGELLWTQNATGNVDSTAIQGALGTQTIWIGADGGFLYNLDVKTGENVLPPIAHPGKMESIPTANADRSVIFTMYRNQPTTPGGGVLAVDAHTGTVLWNITCAGGVPLFVEEHDAVFVAGTDGTIFAANASDGHILWKQDQWTTRFMGPLLFDRNRDLLYGGNFGGEMVALYATSGNVSWTYKIDTGAKGDRLIAAPLGARMSADASKLYFGSYNGELYAVNLD